jgi:hypothetical protein
MKLLVALLAILFFGEALSQAPSWGRPVGPRPESESLAQSVPIADVHMHFDIKRQTVEQMLRRMNESNVRWGGGMCQLLGKLSTQRC